MGINLITITLNIIQMDKPEVKKVFDVESNLAKTYEQSMATTNLGKVNQMQ